MGLRKTKLAAKNIRIVTIQALIPHIPEATSQLRPRSKAARQIQNRGIAAHTVLEVKNKQKCRLSPRFENESAAQVLHGD